MPELTQTELEAKLAAIDAKITTITDALAGGTGAAQYTEYALGQLKVSGQQQIDSLIKAREMYQGLLEKIPKEIHDVTSYDVDVTGTDSSEEIGDE